MQEEAAWLNYFYLITKVLAYNLCWIPHALLINPTNHSSYNIPHTFAYTCIFLMKRRKGTAADKTVYIDTT